MFSFLLQFLSEYLLRFEHYFDNIIAIRPSGWEIRSRPQNRNNISIYGVEYSEHSSYDELRRFVNFINPVSVISTVPSGTSLADTPKIEENWRKVFRYKKSHQTSITSYMKNL